MIAHELIRQWTNHLWQSTLFAVAVALTTLAFRQNRAHVRYWVWLSASVKFLIPFALLMNLGNSLWSIFAGKKIAAELAPRAVSLTVQQIAQPFPEASPFAPATSLTHAADWISIAIFGVWVCGFLGVVLVRFRGWLHIRAAIHASTPIEIHAAAAVRSSPGLLEPGVVGLLLPTLLLPEGILRHLPPSQLETVIAHELSHIKRRDNLTAAIHMVVEAVFWFHPLVWWIGARLVEEREHARDEAVLSLGGEPRDYADAIVSVCKLYVESPLTCVSGISGADLKKRIVRIMARHVGLRMNLGRKLLLVSAGMTALSAPVIAGLFHTPQIRAESLTGDMLTNLPALDLGSIKIRKSMDPFSFPLGASRPTPNGISFVNVSLLVLTREAFGVPADRIENLPDWTRSNWYDIEVDANDAAKLKTHPWAIMLPLLEDRFNLKFHHEVKELLVYSLTVATGGPKLTAVNAAQPGQMNVNTSSEVITFEGNGDTMAPLVQVLEQRLGCTVVDNTELAGAYDFKLSLRGHMILGPMGTSMELTGEPDRPGGDEHPQDSAPLLSAALQAQLGLKLVAQKQAEDVIVIDRLSEPPTN
jgi:uncharacterized protein (TIGR03435 family)